MGLKIFFLNVVLMSIKRRRILEFYVDFKNINLS
jgi:hypothetical protein